jgi:hypothetical protein
LKATTFYNVGGMVLNITQIEARLGPGANTLNAQEYSQFLVQKRDLLQAQVDFYNSAAWRKVQHMRRVSTQKRDAHFLNRFRELFGPPRDDLVIFWGDGFRAGRTFHGQTPATGATTFRKMLLRRGYKVFEVSEMYTSRLCHACMLPMAPACGANTLKDNKASKTQRLYRCRNPLCHIGWIDRDGNAARNIA